MSIKSYQDLLVWQRAMDLTEAVYALTKSFPREEVYGLTSQLRRAAVSVPSNIAEGHGRHTTREYLNYLSIARGSLNEVETQIFLAQRLAYISESQLSRLLSQSSEVGRLLAGLINALSNRHSE